jgi:hypothetical protein
MIVSSKIQKLGYFWLPSDENYKLPGLLKIGDGGNIFVELMGLLEEDKQQWNVEIILGEMGEGEVTLVNCSYIKGKKYGYGT